MQDLINATNEIEYMVMVDKVDTRRGTGTGWSMGYVRYGFTFVPLQSLDGWHQIEKSKWIPAWACEPVVVIPPEIPPEPQPKEYGQVYMDYDQMWQDSNPKYHVSRPTRTWSPRRIRGLPATARFAVDTLVKLTPDLQDWMHKLCWSRAQFISEEDAKKSWRSLMAGDRFITNKTGSGTHADFVNSTNLDKEPMKLQPMVTGGAILNLLGEKVIKGELCYEIEAIDIYDDYRHFTPESYPKLFFRPVNSYRTEITRQNGTWTGTWREDGWEYFPQYGGQAILPILAVGSNRQYISKWRVNTLFPPE